MRKIALAAGIALGLLALPLLASAQDVPAAPDAAPAAGDAATTPAPKKAHHARKHKAKAHHAKTRHAKKASTAAPAATDGGDAAPVAAPQ